MDKILAALDRAWHEPEGAQALRSLANAPELPAGAPAPPKEIAYARTRVIPVSPEALRERHIALGGTDPLANAFKLLSAQVLLRMREGGWRTLAITSPGDHAGKTVVAVNLAISLAREVDHTVLLVDADLRYPRVAEYLGLGLADERGLVDHLVGKAPIEGLLVHPAIGHLVVLPGAGSLPNSAELVRSPAMAALVRELKSRYDNRIVIFDLPPVLSTADALAFSPLVDAALLVVEECATPRDDVRRACELLGSTNLVGVVLNKSRAPVARPYRSRQESGSRLWHRAHSDV